MRALIATVALVVAGLLAPQAATAKLQLRVTKLGDPPATLAPGGAFTVSSTVTRTGAGLRRATLVHLLSTSPRRPVRAIRLSGTRSLASLKRKPTLRGRTRLTVPRTARPGTYHLLACVERLKGPRGTKAPACRAARRKVRVVAAAVPSPKPPAPPPAPAPAPAPAPSANDVAPPPAPAPSGDPARPLAPASPRSVTPALDAPRATTQTVGAAGGTLSATGANGTVFTLTVPAGALPRDTAITMTPLAAVGGLPFDALVGGVDLAPEGLRFAKAVTLTFAPAAPVPLDRQAPFVYSGAGDDFRSYPLVPDPAKLELQLLHFTGAGLAAGSPEQRAAQQASVPANYEAQYEQQLAKAVDDARNGRDASSALQSAGRAFHDNVVRPRLTGAETDDALASLALQTFFAWAHHVALLGLEDDFTAEMDAGTASVRKILEHAFARSFERCAAGEIGEVGRMLGIARTAALLGFDLPIDEGMDKCVRFELDLDLDVVGERTDGFLELGELTVVSDHVPLRLTGPGYLEAPVPLTVAHWNRPTRSCLQMDDSIPTGGTATVTQDAAVRLDIAPGNELEERRPDGGVTVRFEPPQVVLQLQPGAIDLTSPCGNKNNLHTWYATGLRTLWPHLRVTDAHYVLGGTAWTLGTDPWARFADPRTWSGTTFNVDYAWTGALEAVLRHTPVR